MDKSYRVPSIEEFLPGFEYERRLPIGEWVKDHVQKGEDVDPDLICYFNRGIIFNNIRVKSVSLQSSLVGVSLRYYLLKQIDAIEKLPPGLQTSPEIVSKLDTYKEVLTKIDQFSE